MSDAQIRITLHTAKNMMPVPKHIEKKIGLPTRSPPDGGFALADGFGRRDGQGLGVDEAIRIAIRWLHSNRGHLGRLNLDVLAVEIAYRGEANLVHEISALAKAAMALKRGSVHLTGVRRCGCRSKLNEEAARR